MPTNDERREVAARLRRLCGHREVDKEFVHEALGLYMGECVDGYDPVSVSELADLIEPEERTCRNIANKNDREFGAPFICSECGADPHDAESYFCGFSNGEHDWRFCPNCGAKVVHQ